MKSRERLAAFSIFHLLMKRYPKRCIAIVVLSVFVALCEGLSMMLIVTLLDGGIIHKLPSFLEPLIHWLNNGTPVEKVRMIAMLLIGIALCKGSVLYLYNRVSTFMQIEGINLFRIKCVDQLLGVSMRYLHDQKASDLFTVGINHTKWVGSLVNSVSSVFPKIFSGLALLVILLYLSWQLTLTSVALLIMSSLVLRYLSRESRISGDKSNVELMKLSEVLMTMIQGMKEVRLFNKERAFKRCATEHIHNQGKAGFKNAMANTLVAPIFEVTTVVCLGAILCLAAILLSKDNTNWIPSLMSFMLILFKMVWPMTSINQARVQIAGLLPPIIKLFEYLDTNDKEYIANGKIKMRGFYSTIRFKGIGFKYHKQEVLRDINLLIPKGSKIGIVGPSGSGKSTLIELLLRFYDPQEGIIYVDDADIRNLDISSWRNNIGVVSQDTFLFNRSVRENIAFANPSADFQCIEKAARIAYAHEFIKEMPDGYNTLLGDRGIKVSGGQRQRLAIARAILRQPAIMIFDEATSALDSESEKIVQKALNEIGKDKTTFVIAHRLSTVFDADQSIVIDQGRIVQKGRHEELMQKQGLYRRLVELQDLNMTQAKV